MMGLNSAGQRVWEARHNSSNYFVLVDWTSGTTLIQSSGTLATNTEYRFEWKVASSGADCGLFIYAGDQTSNPLGVTRFDANGITGTYSTWDRCRVGMTGGATAPSWAANFAVPGYSDEGYLGVAAAPNPLPITYGRHIVIGG